VNVAKSESLIPVISALKAISENANAKIFRKELFYEMLRAIKEFDRGDYDSLRDAVWQIRNITRRTGRKTSHHSVGTTLLVKGLEFDHSIILDADGMDRKNLYVAMTRGAKTLTILSKQPVLDPSS
jgi:DNA helicase-2/ATP-dependent DNA helicase PcrA